MNLLDENIRDDQRLLLRKWRRIPFRQVGKEISHAGIQDEDLIPFLHRLHRATLFTQDKDFFKPRLRHHSYGLYIDVRYKQVAQFIRRFLKHPLFSARASRLGIVARVHTRGVDFWQKGEGDLQTVKWE